MGLYRFDFHAEGGGSPSVREADYPNDGAAAGDAFRRLRDQAGHIAVEVWNGPRLVTRMERPDTAFLTARSGIHGLG